LPGFTTLVGPGDMLKSTYDPDEDGVIEGTQVEALNFAYPSNKILFYDDFLGGSPLACWIFTGVGSESIQVADNGVIRVSSGTSSGNRRDMHWGDTLPLKVAKNVKYEAKVRSVQIANTVWCIFHLCYLDGTATNYIGVGDYPFADTTYFVAITRAGAVSTTTTTTIARDTAFHVFKVETSPASVKLYIDGTLVATHTTNIPTVGLQPLVYIETTIASAVHIEIDYIIIEGDR